MHYFVHVSHFRNSVLRYSVLIMLASTGYAESERPSTAQDETSFKDEYLLGKEMARSETKFMKPFTTGLAFGVTMPFVSGGSAALLYQSAGHSSLCGVVAGISTASLWVWSGNKLVKHQAVRIPERYHSGLDEQERNTFDSGYIETMSENRRSWYSVGVILGTLIPLGLIWGIFSHVDWSNS